MIFTSRNPITIAILLILSLLLVGAWVMSYSVTRHEETHGEWLQNLQKWELHQPSSFSFELSYGCMYVVEYRVEKTSNGIFEYPIGNSPVGGSFDVSSAFDTAKKTIFASHEATVKYHPYFGFPTSIEVDWDKDTIDDECFYQLSEFKVLDTSET